ncbi:glycosyltransferase [Natrinema limicola]|uniref:Group 1 glycosyl transferase n=1 Tax=Natrinema limicola JCM 13563 TaxID=1230457 RepID=M0C4V7_9EURY|nr:glycosyltransferase [Natrinema limicola]ELZ17698.1 group 1 glycosyl transferase [Natrinema limicola JCM 13563]
MTESEPDRTVLLVSNRRLNENTGRAEKFKTRKKLLAERGWQLEVGYVEPSLTELPIGMRTVVRKARDADVINSVSNPPHLQIAGGIAGRVTGTPWLAEFRDPLVENPDVNLGSPAARIRKQLESYIITHADKVVWYDGIQIADDYFIDTYSDVSNVEQLPPIGFEAEKFNAITPESFEPFTITYAGSFYDGWIEPYGFLRGLDAYIEGANNPNIQAHFYGDWDSDYQHAVSEEGIGDYVQTHSFVPHEEIVGVLKGSDALLYVGGTDPRNSNNLPSKLYDYIGARQPILALVDPNFRVAEVIRDYGLGIVAHPENTEEIHKAITRLVNGEFNFEPASATEFTRERSSAAYIEALEAIS